LNVSGKVGRGREIVSDVDVWSSLQGFVHEMWLEVENVLISRTVLSIAYTVSIGSWPGGDYTRARRKVGRWRIEGGRPR
ncbi:hypothetical protein ACDT12_13535, partial [Staphylococcus aureus]